MATGTQPGLDSIRFGVFELDPKAGELRKSGRKLRLEGQPIQILALLLEKPGEVVSREELKQKLWAEDTFVDFEHGINTGIRRLREALDDSAETPRFIETLPRRGYRFIYPLRPANGISNADHTSGPRNRLRWWMAAGLIVAAAVLLAVVLRDRVPGPRTRLPVASVAVLPFKNLTGDEEQKFLADGITDALTTELARVKKLVVPSVTSAMYYGQANKALPVISRDLHAEAAVEGSVQGSGKDLVLNIQLIDARNDRHMWANSYKCDRDELPSALRIVARDLLREMRVPLSTQELASLNTQGSADPQAVDAYLKGRQHLRRGTEDDRVKARDLLQRAIELDPSYAAPYAELAVIFSHGAVSQPRTTAKERQALTLRLASRALELDPSLADAHGALAWIAAEQWDWPNAEREFLIAKELGPNDSRPWYAYFLGTQRRFAEAIAEAERVIRLDPASPDIIVFAAEPFFQSGRVEDAVRLWRQCLQLDPNSWAAHHYLARAYIKQGRYQEGISELQKSSQLRDADMQKDAIAAYAYARAGQPEHALRILKNLQEEKAAPFALLFAYVGLRDFDRAFRLLDERVAARGPVLWHLSSEPLFEELYLDPRYVVLMRRIGFPEAAVQDAIATARRNAAVKTAQAK